MHSFSVICEQMPSGGDLRLARFDQTKQLASFARFMSGKLRHKLDIEKIQTSETNFIGIFCLITFS